MTRSRLLVLMVALNSAIAAESKGQLSRGPDTVVVQSETLALRALLWRPVGRGPFPAVLFNHGSSGATDPLKPDKPEALGPVFATHGYVFLLLFRRGVGLSAGLGPADGDLMAAAFAAHGQEGRNRVQLQLLQSEELNEAMAGLAFLRSLADVNARHLGVVGHSFGGALTVLLAARDSTLGGAVVFGGAAYSWELSPELRRQLLTAVSRTTVPVFFIHAANDYSISAGTALASEMKRLAKPHALKIYPAAGQTRSDGHGFVYRNVSAWEHDVFAFLDAHLSR